MNNVSGKNVPGRGNSDCESSSEQACVAAAGPVWLEWSESAGARAEGQL